MHARGVTLEQWLAFSPVERDVYVDQLLERLPSSLARVPGEGVLPCFEAQGLRFVLVPAAPVVVGLTDERSREAIWVLERSPIQIFSPDVHLPAWSASVPMHLAATSSFVHDGYDWFGRVAVGELREAIEGHGWRVPSEAEWELQFWLLRTLTSISFSAFGELCRDSWAPAYTTPLDEDGLSRGDAHEVVRLASFDPLTLASAMPSRRPVRSTPMMSVRPVIDIPF